MIQEEFTINCSAHTAANLFSALVSYAMSLLMLLLAGYTEWGPEFFFRFFLPMALIILALAVYLTLNYFNREVTITNDGITTTDLLLRTRSYKWEQIQEIRKELHKPYICFCFTDGFKVKVRENDKDYFKLRDYLEKRHK